MSRLVHALIELTEGLTGDQLHEIIGGSRATAHRRLGELRERKSIKRWSALSLELLAAWEQRKYGSQTIGESLCADCEEEGYVDPEELKAQINQAQRKNSSLMHDLLPIKSENDIAPPSVRGVIDKTEAAARESARQCSLLRRFMRSLKNRIKYGVPIRPPGQ